jgi:hypothetical protein
VEYVGVEEWSPLDDLMPFDELSALERDVLLKGSLLIVVRRPDGSPRAGKKVVIRGCGFVWGKTSAVTGRDGSASVEAPIGRVEIEVGRVREEAWVSLDRETFVAITYWATTGLLTRVALAGRCLRRLHSRAIPAARSVW